MVISHKYRYLFIETPQTGCSAIRKELILNYDGESILSKHSSYYEFLKIASKDERKYFVFLGVRNPLDTIVSKYVKLKNNHRDRYTKRLKFNFSRQLLFDIRDYFIYKKVKKENFSFEDYINQNYLYLFDNISTLYKSKLNGVVKFENLNEDFKKILKKLKIEPIRDLPIYNNTKNKIPFDQYYSNNRIKQKALIKCGIFMQIWKYNVPNSEWPLIKINIFQKILWKILRLFRIISWKFIRYKLKDV
tara:strand:+ start:70 stop:810 length:741 start_codon:yes stop_codon:yes gene_type:complete